VQAILSFSGVRRPAEKVALIALAEEAVSCEPVSTAGFPANREKNREFR
jgi:hypothetical protein